MNSSAFSVNNLSDEDSIYLKNVMIDIRSYINSLHISTHKKIVLLFPPVNNFRRFLIHQLINNTFQKEQLSTLSVGRLYGRRTVVYPSILKPMDVKCADVVPEQKSNVGKEVITVPLSRPPAVRNSDNSCQRKEKRYRKPDLQIYVPRGRRLFTSVRDDEQGNSDEIDNEQKSINPKEPSVKVLHTPKKKKIILASNSPDKPKIDSCDSSLSKPNTVVDVLDVSVNDLENDLSKENLTELDCEEIIASDLDVSLNANDNSLFEITKDSDLQNYNDEGDENSLIDLTSGQCSETEIRRDVTVNSSSVPVVKNETPPHIRQTEKIYCNTNYPVIDLETYDEEKKTTEDDVIEIISVDSTSPEKNAATSDVEILLEKKPSNRKLTSTLRSTKRDSSLNVNDCEWDELFDEEGEYVDKTLINELVTAIGEVSVRHAAQNYKPFQTAEERTSDGGCVVEVYGFPSEFKTDDLCSIFATYRKDPAFQIVWVDDTHALAVFSSPTLADEVLNTELPFVKTRPIKNAIPKSREKAQNFILPPVTRPKTCVSLARRLVSGHLGMKVNVSDQQKAAEKKILSEAREKRRLVAKQKQNAWEGTL